MAKVICDGRRKKFCWHSSDDKCDHAVRHERHTDCRWPFCQDYEATEHPVSCVPVKKARKA